MIRYTPANQLSLEGFAHPFENPLDPDNRWIKLAKLIPWDELAKVYATSLQSDSGRLSADIRLVIGALVIKHKLKMTDRETVKTISENPYMQYFCGMKSFQTEEPFDSSLFVEIRKRMGADKFDRFNDIIIEHSENLKRKHKQVKRKPYKEPARDTERTDQPEGIQNEPDNKKNESLPDEPMEDKKEDVPYTQPPSTVNKGTLKIDATACDQQILYPTDLGLLNRCREESERIIDILHKEATALKLTTSKKPRTYRCSARAVYLSIAKQKRKNKKVIRKGIGQQLRYLRRNIKSIEKLLDLFEGAEGIKFPLDHRTHRIYWVIQHVYEQQRFMYENRIHSHLYRIVNIYQPYVRPIVRGKDKAAVEFGAKINISEYNGMSKIDHIGWEAYNEATDMVKQIERYKNTFGYYPELVLADKIYLNRENRAWLKEKGIRTVGKPLGRPPQEQLNPHQKQRQREERNQRNLVEGKFGQGKNGYALNNIKARRQDTSESWISAIFFVMNLVTLFKEAEKLFLRLSLPLLRPGMKQISSAIAFRHGIYHSLADWQKDIPALLLLYSPFSQNLPKNFSL
jgi:transposase, IS5 family